MNRIDTATICGLFSIAALATGGCADMSVPEDNGGTMAESDGTDGTMTDSGGTDGATTDPDGTEAPTPTGVELFAIIMQDDPYQDWGQFPDFQGTLPSALPHGPMSRVFINSEVESILDAFDGALPDGSIIVKENVGVDPSVTEAALTVMWKVTGFDPDNNDWFWANMTPQGEIVAEGAVPACAACHGGARANDFIFVQQF